MDTSRTALDTDIGVAIAKLRERIQGACARCDRDPGDVRLMAVTKFNPSSAVQAAYAAGIRLFGENRVQEAAGKFSRMDGVPAGTLPGAAVHMLGHLQSNKARRAVELFDCIQSIDSPGIIGVLAKHSAAIGKQLDILLELHTGESSKTGFPDLESLVAAADMVYDLPSLRLRGLMTMAPYTSDQPVIQAACRQCREAFDLVRDSHDWSCFDTLSMGMTNDFEIAIMEGSTLVRIGTAIFGEREYAP
jgi:hypothetical protein